MISLPHPGIGPMVNAVGAACRICRRVQQDLVNAGVVEKGDRSPVTIADFASQAMVSGLLAEVQPGIPLVAEERADLLREPGNEALREAVLAAVRHAREAPDSEILDAIDRGAAEPGDRCFVLDPIDGTKGFLRGEQYAVALALMEEGRPVLGVLGCPNLPGAGGAPGTIFVAVEGRGAFCLSMSDPWASVAPVRVSDRSDPADTRFCESVEKAHSHKGRSARIAEVLGVRAAPVRIDSQCKYGLVARGDAELYLRIPRDTAYREKIWDHASGAILLAEAGGRVTDLDGRDLDFSRGRTLEGNRGIVGSNGLVHDAVLAAARKTLEVDP